MADTPKPSSSGEAKSANSNNKKVLIIVGAIVGALLILGIVGSLLAGYLFSKAGEEILEGVTDSQLEVNGNEVTIEGQDGQELNINSAELPQDFPEVVPLYDDARLVSASSFGGEGQQTFSVTYSTPDSTSEVFEFYQQAISPDNGFAVVSTQQNTEGISSVAGTHSGEKYYVSSSALYDEDSGGSTIQITVREQSDNQ